MGGVDADGGALRLHNASSTHVERTRGERRTARATASRARDSRVYNAKLIELILPRARAGAAFRQFIMGLRCKYVNQGSNLPWRSPLPSSRRWARRCDTPLPPRLFFVFFAPFPPTRRRASRAERGAAITSCVNKHSSSRLAHP